MGRGGFLSTSKTVAPTSVLRGTTGAAGYLQNVSSLITMPCKCRMLFVSNTSGSIIRVRAVLLDTAVFGDAVTELTDILFDFIIANNTTMDIAMDGTWQIGKFAIRPAAAAPTTTNIVVRGLPCHGSA